MTTIYLTRHGQTMWNLDKRLQGIGNSELTEVGINQAKGLSERLVDINIDIIYTSPLKRAYETAKILKGKKDIELRRIEGLKEISFGEYEGHTEEELLKAGVGKEIGLILNGDREVKAPGGETLNELYERVKNALDNIIQESCGKNILIVSHGITLKAIVVYFKGEGILYNEIIGQATLTKIVKENEEYRFEYLNDKSHLREGNNTGW